MQPRPPDTATEHQAAEDEPLLAGKYRLLQLMKEGGMGSVYVAERVGSGQKVAIKLLHDDAAEHPEAVLRLYTEASAASSVGHPGIVHVLELGTDEDGVPFLVMELLEGESLDEMLQRQSMLGPTLATNIVAQTLSALAAAHEKGIVHRDLKPENIFITKAADGTPLVKLLDFGISKIWRHGIQLNLTQTGTVWGTPYYMSPEHARGAKDIDGQTDIWAVGVILYQALTGRLPYEGETYNELLAKILGEPFTRPRELSPDISRPLEQVILKSLTKERKWRYATADEFHDDLVQATGGTGPGRWLVGASPIKPGGTGLLGTVSRRWITTTIVAVSLLGGLTGLRISGKLSELSERLSSIGGSNEPTGPESLEQGTAQASPEPADGPRVLVLVDHVPEDLEVRYDGRPERDNPFSAPQQARPAVLQLVRNGSVVVETTLVPDRDLRVDAADLLASTEATEGADSGPTEAVGNPPVHTSDAPVSGAPLVTTVEVRVQVHPELAHTVVRIDGERVPDGVARVRPDRVHRITVSAPGYQRQEIHRRIAEDTVVEVRLSMERRPDHGPGATESGDSELPRYKRREVGIVTEYPQ